eukprot:6243196-Karenia_brevis.AAC.1
MTGIVNQWDANFRKECVKSQWDLDLAPNPWSRVKGPMGATHMHLTDMGWKAQINAGAFLLEDTARDIWKPNPSYGMGF